MAICLAFQMDFLFFREREKAHLVIRSWAEIATSGSLAPHSTCPLSHAAPASVAAAPVARPPQMEAIKRPPAKWKFLEGGGSCLSSSLYFLSRPLGLLLAISLLIFF